MSLRRRKLTALAEQVARDDVDRDLENATDTELVELTFADVMFSGLMLSGLAERVAAEERGEKLPPLDRDSEALAHVVERVRLRERLGLPHRECVVEDPPPEAERCLCLQETLDVLLASEKPPTCAAVLKAARRTHAERWAWLKRKPEPRPQRPAPDPSPPPAPKRKPKPAPPRELVSQTNTKPARIVRRRKRWYDRDAPSASDFRDMTF